MQRHTSYRKHSRQRERRGALSHTKANIQEIALKGRQDLSAWRGSERAVVLINHASTDRDASELVDIPPVAEKQLRLILGDAGQGDTLNATCGWPDILIYPAQHDRETVIIVGEVELGSVSSVTAGIGKTNCLVPVGAPPIQQPPPQTRLR